MELTEACWSLRQESVAAQATREQELASALTDTEKRQLNDLLRRLSHALDPAPKDEGS